MLRYRDFRPQAAGIRAMLPHVDRFLPAHNLRSIVDLIGILDQAGGAYSRTGVMPDAWADGRAEEAA
jgi:hypothetical protein